VRIRILWLLERIASHEGFFRGPESKQDLKLIFERLVELLISPNQLFPEKYVCLRAVYRYTKRIKVKEIYPDNFQAILVSILSQINASILVHCNEDTVNIPIQALRYFAQIDSESTLRFTSQEPQFMKNLQALYSRFFSDGFLGEDVLELI